MTTTALRCFAAALVVASMAPAAAVDVRVVDAPGKPVGGAMVHVPPAQPALAVAASPAGASLPEPRPKAWTDAEGLAAIDVGDADVACILADGFAPTQVRLTGAARPVEVRLQPAARVRARAVQPDGRAIPNCAVRIATPRWLTDCVEPRATDATGTSALDLPAGPVALRFDGGRDFVAPVTRELEARSGKEQRVDAVLTPAVHLTLTVTGDNIRPLVGATVRALAPATSPSSGLRRPEHAAVAKTAMRGIAQLPPLPRRPTWRVAAWAPGYAPRSVLVAANAAEGRGSCPLVAGGTIRLRVVDEIGAPRSKPTARVTESTSPDADLLPELVTGDDLGSLVLADLPAGTHVLELRAPGGRPRLLKGVAVTPAKVSNLGDVIVPDGVRLTGVVVDEADEPFAKATVVLTSHVEGRAWSATQATDAEGRFAFEDLDPTVRVALAVDSEICVADAALPVSGFDTPVVLRIQRAGIVEVTAEDADTAFELSDFAAAATCLDCAAKTRVKELWGSSGQFAVSTLPDPPPASIPAVEGIARLTRLPRGRYSVLVTAPDHVPTTTDPIDVTAATSPLAVRASLSRGSVLVGRTIDATSREPIEGAAVDVRSGGQSVAQAVTGPDGTFVVRDLPREVDLHVIRPPHRPLERKTLPVEGEGREVVLPMEPGAVVEGLVRKPGGGGRPGAFVSAAGSSTVTNEEGRYRLEGLPLEATGVRKVNREGSADGLEVKRLFIREGTNVLDFGEGGVVRGVVTRSGEPVFDALVGVTYIADGLQLGDGGPNSFFPRLGELSATTDTLGRYEVTGVPAGECFVAVDWQGRTFSRFLDYPPDAPEVDLDLEVPETTLSGRVVDSVDGSPLANVLVTAISEGIGDDRYVPGASSGPRASPVPLFANRAQGTAVTDSAGRFELLIDSPGRTTVSTSAPRTFPAVSDSTWTGDVRDSVSGITLKLARTVTVEISIRDALTGAAIDQVEVDVVAVLPAGHGIVAATSDARGVARLPNVPNDRRLVVVAAKPPDYLPATLALERADSRPRVLTLGASGDLVVCGPPQWIVPSDRSSLSLVDANGVNLLGSVGVRLSDVAEQLDDECWKVERIPAGPYGITLTHAGDVRTTTAQIGPGAVTMADLR